MQSRRHLGSKVGLQLIVAPLQPLLKAGPAKARMGLLLSNICDVDPPGPGWRCNSSALQMASFSLTFVEVGK